VSVSRYTARDHFLSDALVGSVIGFGIGRYVYRELSVNRYTCLTHKPYHLTEGSHSIGAYWRHKKEKVRYLPNDRQVSANRLSVSVPSQFHYTPESLPCPIPDIQNERGNSVPLTVDNPSYPKLPPLQNRWWISASDRESNSVKVILLLFSTTIYSYFLSSSDFGDIYFLYHQFIKS
jgi:hypothetical protein